MRVNGVPWRTPWSLGLGLGLGSLLVLGLNLGLGLGYLGARRRDALAYSLTHSLTLAHAVEMHLLTHSLTHSLTLAHAVEMAIPEGRRTVTGLTLESAFLLSGQM